MPIRVQTLLRHSEKSLVVLDGNRTLANALEQAREHGYQFNSTYLVVVGGTERERQYFVALLGDLGVEIARLGYDAFELALVELPILPADRVVLVTTTESGRAILDWVAARPESKVVVTDNDRPVGLFTNPNRSETSGWLDGVSLLQLQGELVRLYKDPRAEFVARVKPPFCPQCQTRHFFRFDTSSRTYICPVGGKAVDLP